MVGARGPAVAAAAARGAGVGSIGGSRRGLSWVKDVTVNVTFINHEVLVYVYMCMGRRGETAGGRSCHEFRRIKCQSVIHALPPSLLPKTQQGLRITVPGRVGQSLLDVAQMHDIELESGCGGGGAEQQKKHSERWTEDLFGRGECGRGGKRGDERTTNCMARTILGDGEERN